MGAWGVEIDANDTALDFQGDFQGLMREGLYTPYDAIDKLLHDEYNNNIDCVLMAGKIELDIFGEVKHFDKVISALDEALLEENLGMWSEPDKRKEELQWFKDCVIDASKLHKNNISAIELKDMLIQYADEDLARMKVTTSTHDYIKNVSVIGSELIIDL